MDEKDKPFAFNFGLNGMNINPGPFVSMKDPEVEFKRQQRQHWTYTFAGMALQGVIAKWHVSGTKFEMTDPEGTAKLSYKFAEALLSELEKREADNGKKD